MSENVNFYQGSKEKYNPSEMQGGLYFSKDSKEILLNGESYGNATPADEEDITAENGNLKLRDRAYDADNFSGKGYKILRKNIVEGKNVLTQDMINEANTVYEIRYDFDLNGATITIPEGCLLKFEGGSFSNGTIVGSQTRIIGTDSIFQSNCIVQGGFDVEYVLANWFVRSNSSQMFQAAIDLAKSISNSFTTSNYEFVSVPVKCIPSVYTIDQTISIPVFVSFDGCGSTFAPTDNLVQKYMFYCNISDTDESTWEIQYPNNVRDSIGNFYFSNPKSLIVHMVKCGDSRIIHNIDAFRPAKAVCYTSNYIDHKVLKDIIISGENWNYALDNTSDDTLSDTSCIWLWLGDACVIDGLQGGSVYVGGGANVRMTSLINVDITISNSRNITIQNIHQESGVIYLSGASLSITDGYFWAQQDGNFRAFALYNNFPELILTNCQFGNLLNLSDFNSWSPVRTDTIRVIYNNCFALINNGTGGHNSGQAISLVNLNNKLINPIRCVEDSGEIIEDNLAVASKDSLSYFYPEETGSGYHIRLILLVDKDRGLYIPVNKYMEDIEVSLPVTLTDYNWLESAAKIPGAILRIEIGENSTYSQYFDMGIVSKKEGYVKLDLNDSIYTFEGLPFKNIDYSYEYIQVSHYYRNQNNINIVTNNKLPDVALMSDNDVVTFSNGRQFKVLSGQYIETESKWALIE